MKKVSKDINLTKKHLFLKNLILILTLQIFCLFFSYSSTRSKPLNILEKYPFSIYGEEILFDVFRKNEKVGFHRVKFSNQNSTLLVKSEFKLQIDFLFLTAFFFHYQSETNWKNGALIRLKAITNDDGDTYAFKAFIKNNKMVIKDDTSSTTSDLPLFPTNHWNSEVLGQKKVLNTLTGKVNNVLISKVSREAVQTEIGEILATRYAYTGDLDTEIWYDDKGRWVKMRFKGRDGSVITYKCQMCQG